MGETIPEPGERKAALIQISDLPTELALPVQVLFERRLPDAIKITLLQLLALAAGSPGRVTPPLTFPALRALTGKSRTTLHAHLTALRGFQDLLCQENLPDGSFIFRMTDPTGRGVRKSGFLYP